MPAADRASTAVRHEAGGQRAARGAAAARREVWGRPVGLLELPDGSILVFEDGGNKIWRASYAG